VKFLDSRRQQSKRYQQQFKKLKPFSLRLEDLEDRRLMAADLFSASASSERLVVAYQDKPSAIVSVDASQFGSVESALAAIESDPSVRYAEVDYRVEAAVVPTDARFTDTWGLNNTNDVDIDAPEAWDVTTGSMLTTVAIIDSGIDYTHADLYLNVWLNQGEIPTAIKNTLVDVDGDSLFTFRDLNDTRNQGQGKITDQNGNQRIDGGDLLKAYRSDGFGGWADGVSNDGDSYVDDLVGWNFDANNNNPFDDNGHGTHVAGTIGAIANNTIGVAGILWNVQLVGLKFLDSTGGGYTSSAVAALNYAVSHSIDVSNNSWGGGGYSQSLYDAINNAKNHGHIFVVAAGNGGNDGVGDNNNTVSNYPANYNLNNIISVAATDRYDRLASFSNYGSTTVDIAAPGVGITSTVPGGYANYSGTSMATPHVTGVVAMVMTEHPDWTYTQVINQVLSKADKVSTLDGKVVTGGRLNAFNAVNTSTTTPAPVPSVSGARIVSAVTLNASNGGIKGVRLTFDEAISASSFTTSDITGFVGPTGLLSVNKVAAVAGSNGLQFDVLFGTRTTAGNYSFSVGPDVLDASGNKMDQDQDGTSGESTQDRYVVQFAINPTYTYSSTASPAILDGKGVPVSVIVDRDLTITDLNVKLDITHSYDGDLYIYLVGPDGTSVELVNFRGGSGNNFWVTRLNDEAATSIASGIAPFNGAFRPEQSLTAFDGKNARGTWTLWVEDWYQGDTGRVNSVSLTFASVSSSSANGSALFVADTGAVDVAPDAPRHKQVAAETPASKSLKVTKTQAVSALFAWQDQHHEQPDSFQAAKSVVKKSDDFSWGAAVDEFMARLASAAAGAI